MSNLAQPLSVQSVIQFDQPYCYADSENSNMNSSWGSSENKNLILKKMKSSIKMKPYEHLERSKNFNQNLNFQSAKCDHSLKEFLEKITT